MASTPGTPSAQGQVIITIMSVVIVHSTVDIITIMSFVVVHSTVNMITIMSFVIIHSTVDIITIIIIIIIISMINITITNAIVDYKCYYYYYNIIIIIIIIINVRPLSTMIAVPQKGGPKRGIRKTVTFE